MSLSRRIRVWVPRAVRDRSRRPRPVPNHPVVEVLEGRCTPSTFVVTTTNDSGAGSLRAAILQTNAAAGPDHIAFAIPTSDARFEDANHNRRFDPGDFWSIRPTAALPAISDRVTLDGWSQGAPATTDSRSSNWTAGMPAQAPMAWCSPIIGTARCAASSSTASTATE
jgi:hypothetical protein